MDCNYKEAREMVAPSYTLQVRRTADGLVRECAGPETAPWSEGSLYYLTEGNFGCDCNRHLMFERAGGADPDIMGHPCGATRYSILSATLPDGTVVPVDGVRGGVG